jgi:hypothetical protein
VPGGTELTDPVGDAWVRAAGVVLVGPEEDGPQVNADGMCFNGGGTDELGGGEDGLCAEPLWISRTTDDMLSFMYDGRGVVRMICKTERFPCDVAVCAVLLRCHLLALAAFLIDSDGDWDKEWANGTGWPPTEGMSARGLVAELFDDTPTTCPFTDTHRPV